MNNQGALVGRHKQAEASGSESSAPELVRLGVVDELVGYHIRRAANVFLTDFAETLAGTGMRQVLFGILSTICQNPGISQGRVGEALGIQRGNMVSLVTELEEMGLVHRTTVANNRRALSLTLTAEGDKALVDCLGKIREHENRLLAGLSHDERSLLVELLTRVGKNEPREAR